MRAPPRRIGARSVSLACPGSRSSEGASFPHRRSSFPKATSSAPSPSRSPRHRPTGNSKTGVGGRMSLGPNTRHTCPPVQEDPRAHPHPDRRLRAVRSPQGHSRHRVGHRTSRVRARTAPSAGISLPGTSANPKASYNTSSSWPSPSRSGTGSNRGQSPEPWIDTESSKGQPSPKDHPQLAGSRRRVVEKGQVPEPIAIEIASSGHRVNATERRQNIERVDIECRTDRLVS